MTEPDPLPPEYTWILPLARDSMLAFGRRHGRFARTWAELGRDGFSAAGGSTGSYRAGEPGSSPSAIDREIWRPLRARYRYRLVSNDRAFRVQAIDEAGNARFEISHESPRIVRLA